MTDIKTYKLDAAFTSLDKFDGFNDPGAFIEVAIWHNGEGFDVNLNCHGEQRFHLSWGQFKAMKKLIKELDK